MPQKHEIYSFFYNFSKVSAENFRGEDWLDVNRPAKNTLVLIKVLRI